MRRSTREPNSRSRIRRRDRARVPARLSPATETSVELFEERERKKIEKGKVFLLHTVSSQRFEFHFHRYAAVFLYLFDFDEFSYGKKKDPFEKYLGKVT